MKAAKKVCGAKTRAGGKCQRGAGAGTDHVGHGKCKLHGGATRTGKVAAAKAEAVETAALLLGAAPDIAPHDAILLCLRSAWGEWHFWETQIATLKHADVIERQSAQSMGGKDADVEWLEGRQEAHLYIQLRNASRDKVARYAQMAAQMGVAERQIQLAEQFGDTIARLIDGIITDLKLTPGQKKSYPQIAARHLQLLDGGVAM